MTAHTLHRLSARRVDTETRKGRYADGGGLYLQISEARTKSWLFRFTLDGSSRQMGLGSLNTIGLRDARISADRCRRQLLDGVDPIEARRRDRTNRKLDAASNITFRQCAEDYIASHQAAWSSSKHAAQWSRTLETFAYPVIGSMPVDAINTAFVMEVLKPIWNEKSETASRVRGRIEAILDWASTQEYRSGENPARWKGHLANLLPAKNKVKKVKHHAALPYDQIASFIERLKGSDGISGKGLEFLILTAARTGEVIGARWSEVDMAKMVWTIPADRMKAKREHRVPLSDRSIEILNEMDGGKVSDFVFP
ncbi:MAG: integrase arm-type DNA-binding domain-containing protein, partial [Rhodospirillaceae bacterium]|nr:integrase arm-type DNA-binding domain-containing protein [Rhodospirillaceae bacterium]